ncbi:MAG: sugar ABC transporter permease [Thermotogae bacterium]|nr:sugar ABC transporter permease [Thermotogota bacterium]
MVKRDSLKKKERVKGWFMISPYLIMTAIFWGIPFGWLIFLAFSRWNYFTSPRFVGLRNFTRALFHDQLFWQSLINTLNFMLYFIPIVLISAILFALALQAVPRFKTFFALSFLVANIASGVAYSIMFSKIFSEVGPINKLLYNLFGITIPWFSNPQLALFSISLMVAWKFIGYYGLIVFAGLQAIPRYLYEAAELDGARRWTKFFRITLPLLNPSMVMVIVMGISLAFGIFTEPFMITGGGPMHRTYTPMLLLYTTAFQKMRPGYAATMGILVAFISFGCIWLTRKLIERDVTLV